MQCILCLESNQNVETCIEVDSKQWQELSIKKLIDTHLWPIEIAATKSYLCSSCWEELNDFHKFYSHIEEAHNCIKWLSPDPLKDDNKPKELLMEDLLETEMEIGSEMNISSVVKEEDEEITIVESYDSDNDDEQQIEMLDDDQPFTDESGEDDDGTNSCDDPTAKSSVGKDMVTDDKTNTDISNETAENQNNIARKLYQLSRISREQYDEFLSEHFKIICDKCQQPFERFRLLSLHYRKEHNERGYVKCCDTKFFNRMQLVDHINYHLNPEYFKCALCSKAFSQRNHLLGHMKIHDEKAYVCDICKKKFVHKYNLKKHIDTLKHFPPAIEKQNRSDDDGSNQSDSPTKSTSKSRGTANYNLDEHDEFINEHFKIVCSKCDEPFEMFHLLSQHCRKEHNEPGFVVCCEKKLLSRNELLDHINYHLNPEYFKCVHCGKVFAKRTYLMDHLKFHEEKKYSCDMCDKKFVREKILERHKLTHAERTFQCKECGKYYVNEAVLTQHQRVVHLNIYGKVCDICGQNIIGTHLFKLHMEKHNGSAAATSFKCEDCGLILGSKQALRLHTKVKHSVDGQRDYNCHLCTKVSPNQWALKRHIREVHEMEEKYNCTVCEKKFKRPRHLKFHMATHTGISIYRCAWCPKEFNSSSNINSHRKKVHPVEWEAELRKKYSGNLPPNFKRP